MAGLEDLYKEIIVDHYKNPRNKGTLPTPPAVEEPGTNPYCGDEVVVYVQVDDGVGTDVAVEGRGCSISQASLSMMSEAIKGKPVDEVRGLIDDFKEMMTGAEPDAGDVMKKGELAALTGVRKFPDRIKCAILSWNTLGQALDKSGDSA